MEPLESGVIEHIFKLLTKIVNFLAAQVQVKLSRLFEESDIYLEKYIK
jgi:hypothetical protein